MIRRPLISILSLTVLLAVSACQTAPHEFGGGDPVMPLTSKDKMKISARNAILEDRYKNIERGALASAETAYRNSPSDPNLSLNYARLLRQVEMIDQAKMILKPFAVNPDKADIGILVEYTKIKLSLGDFEGAQIFAQEAIIKQPDNASALMVLGVAVDAQGHHQSAENHFRHALLNSKTNLDLQKLIKNNLALSLIAQGKNTEAHSILSGLKNISDGLKYGTVQANKSMADNL